MSKAWLDESDGGAGYFVVRCVTGRGKTGHAILVRKSDMRPRYTKELLYLTMQSGPREKPWHRAPKQLLALYQRECRARRWVYLS